MNLTNLNRRYALIILLFMLTSYGDTYFQNGGVAFFFDYNKYVSGNGLTVVFSWTAVFFYFIFLDKVKVN